MPYDAKRVDAAKSQRYQSPCDPSQRIDFWIEADVPKYLYRYMERQFADDLIGKGRIRFGTLFEYRHADASKLTEAQRDEFEGTHTFTGKGVVNGNEVPMVAPIVSYDCWMLCLSEVYDETLIHERVFGKADCIVKIEAARFFEQLSRALVLFSDAASLRKVQYLKESDYQVSGLDLAKPEEVPFVAIVKPWREDYVRQREWRLTFDPRAGFSSQPRDRAVALPCLVDIPRSGPGVPPQAMERVFKKVNKLQHRFITAPAIRGACSIAFHRD